MAEFDPKAFLAKRRKEQPSIPADPPQASPFDPEAFLAAQAPRPQGPSRLRAVGLAARSGPTLGADDELGGFLQGHAQFGASVSDAIYPDALLKWFRDRGIGFEPVRDADGQPISPIDVFRGARDANEREKEEVRAAHPGTFFLTELLSGAALPLGTARTLGGAMKTGAVVGGAAGLANSDADLTRGEFGEALTDIGTGVTLGSLLGAGGHTAGRVAPAILRWARSALERKAIEQGRRVLLNGADSLSSRAPTSDDAVREALESGAIKPFGTTQGAAQRLEAMTEQQSQAYGATLARLEELGVVGPRANELALEMASRATEITPNTMNDAIPDVYVEEALRVLQKAGDSDNLRLTQAENLKRSLQDKARYGRIEETPLNEARRDVASIFRRANEEMVEQAGRAAPDTSDVRHLAEAFVPVKQRLGRLIEARDAAERGAARAAQRRMFSLSDNLLMSGNIAAGGPAGAVSGAAMGAANNFLRNRGTSAAARAMFGTSRLARLLAGAAARNPTALPDAGLRLSSGFERALDSESQADGLTSKERETLADLLRKLRGDR